MIREIYTREHSDENYIPNTLDKVDPIEEVLAKVRMCLGTTKGEVLGDRDFGIDIEKLVFQTTKSAGQIESELSELINTYVNGLPNITVSTTIEFGHGESSDYAVISVNVNDNRIAGYLID